jgi:Diacylglycerol kinase catalytic domain
LSSLSDFLWILCRLIAVGGDGIFNEILDAVISLAQDEKITRKSVLKSPSMRVGIIPAGKKFDLNLTILTLLTVEVG